MLICICFWISRFCRMNEEAWSTLRTHSRQVDYLRSGVTGNPSFMITNRFRNSADMGERKL